MTLFNSTIYEVIEEITDQRLMMHMMLNMNNSDLSNLFFILDYCNEETQRKWMQAYKNMRRDLID